MDEIKMLSAEVSKMYNGIGKKIKNLTLFIVLVEILVSICVGIAITYYLRSSYFTEELSFLGLLVGFLGIIASWISGFFLYGFGELIDQTTQINTRQKLEKDEKDISAKIEKLNQWKQNGLIDEEDYNKKIKELRG